MYSTAVPQWLGCANPRPADSIVNVLLVGRSSLIVYGLFYYDIHAQLGHYMSTCRWLQGNDAFPVKKKMIDDDGTGCRVRYEGFCVGGEKLQGKSSLSEGGWFNERWTKGMVGMVHVDLSGNKPKQSPLLLGVKHIIGWSRQKLLLPYFLYSHRLVIQLNDRIHANDLLSLQNLVGQRGRNSFNLLIQLLQGRR